MDMKFVVFALSAMVPLRATIVPILTVLLFGLTACADFSSGHQPPQQQTPINDSLITSTRAGPIYLGMPIQQLRSLYGAPAGIQTQGSYLQADYGRPSTPNMIIGIDQKQRVCRIFVYDDALATQDGVRVNHATQFDLRAILGAPDYIYEHIDRYSNTNQWVWGYRKLGMEFSGRY
ncbi:MAG TPA: hypothetical protein VEZ90_10175, partial [Blastocatellia bacterium]|nr:hypothetical protein [Blastocatellia bacterium]